MLSFQSISRIAIGSLYSVGSRSLSVTPINNIKEISARKEGKSLIVEGVTLPSTREALLVRKEPTLTDNGVVPCYLCTLDLPLKHTDVLILSQFVRTDGCMLPKRITGLCSMQQKRVSILVAMAQKAGLMINLTPRGCRKDPKKRGMWKKFNTYYDEKTIFEKKPIKKRGLFKYLWNTV